MPEDGRQVERLVRRAEAVARRVHGAEQKERRGARHPIEKGRAGRLQRQPSSAVGP